MTRQQVVAFSGGDDSTAMALVMAERGEQFSLLFTPAGDEPDDLFDHIAHIVRLTGKELIQPPNRPLAFWIDYHNALPNFRMRWCTRLIKIQPCINWLTEHPGSTLCVGLRADEDERVGLYGDVATYRYPLRELGWKDHDVHAYNRSRGVTVPKRTNCQRCYHQRLPEWWELWKTRPDVFASAESDEDRTGYTFRTPGRDTWPVALRGLRAEFERGAIPRDVELNLNLFDDDAPKACRVCTL